MAMPVQTEICNDALAALGSGADKVWLDDYDTDEGTTADACRKLLDSSRRAVLSGFAFIETVQYLAGTDAGADDSAVVHPDWLYAYPLPQEPKCLRFLGLLANNGGDYNGAHILLDRERYGAHVLTDYTTSEFWWWYIRDEEDFSVLSQPCRDAIAALLAAKLACPVIRGPDGYVKRRELLREYQLLWRRDAIVFNQRQTAGLPTADETRTIDII